MLPRKYPKSERTGDNCWFGFLFAVAKEQMPTPGKKKKAKWKKSEEKFNKKHHFPKTKTILNNWPRLSSVLLTFLEIAIISFANFQRHAKADLG